MLASPTAVFLKTPGANRSTNKEAIDSPTIDSAIERAARYLIGKQSSDGAWRSEVYGNMKDGTSLTPTVLNTLVFLPQAGEAGKNAFTKGVDFVVRLVGPDGKLKPPFGGLDYPVLTAGPACRVLALSPQTEKVLRARKVWLDYLLERRLSAALGWHPTDAEFGGWGFAPMIPRKSPSGARIPLVESNLVATLFGILGLLSAKTPKTDPIWREVLQFVFRCQNFTEKPKDADSEFEDGGFFFIPGDAAQNKAGSAGKDKSGHERFRSYGSMTADGLRALVRCGLAKDHPRVVAARKWLDSHYSAEVHPGDFAGDRAVLRDATYFYRAWAVAHAYLALDTKEIETPRGKIGWAEPLAQALIEQQRTDGSWKNRFTASREDDPLIATSLAVSALAISQQMLT